MEKEIVPKTHWVISVRSGINRKDFTLWSGENETPQEAYKRVKRHADKLKEKVGDNATVDIISYTVTFSPKGEKTRRGQLWCPYCNKWRHFKYDDYLGVNKCNICGISDRDFYVCKYNGLWKKDLANLRRPKL